MYFFTLFLLVCKFLALTVSQTQPSRWPYCGSFGHLGAYPLGCKTGPFDLCVRRDEECRELVCGEVFQNPEACQESCNRATGSVFDEPSHPHISICWCMWKDDLVCLRPSNLLEVFSQKQSFSAETRSPIKKRQIDASLWGVGYQIPNEVYVPVFCFGQTWECRNPPKIICSDDKCQQGGCFIQGFCYHFEQFDPLNSGSCQNGWPTPIESRQQWDEFETILLDSWNALENVHIIATDGRLLPNTLELVWKSDINKNSPLDTIKELIEFPTNQRAEELMLVAEVVFERQGTFLTWKFIEIDSDTTQWILCRNPSAAISPPTTTTTARPCTSRCRSTGLYNDNWYCCKETNCTEACPLGASGTAHWSCGVSEFHPVWPEYSECRSPWVEKLNNTIQNGEISSSNVLTEINKHLDDRTIFGVELIIVLQFTKDSLDLLLKENSQYPPATQLDQIKNLTESTMRVIDKILQLDKIIESLRENQKIQLGTKIQKVCELFGFAVTKKAADIGMTSFNISNVLKNIHMEAQFLNVEDKRLIAEFPITGNDSLESNIKVTKISDELLLLQAVGTHLNFDVAEKLFPSDFNSLNEERKKINAGIISMTLREYMHNITESNEINLNMSVLITFKHDKPAKGPKFATINRKLYPDEKPAAILGSAICVFWNSSRGEWGEWDTEGCKLVDSNKWFTMCECNHLSSFALLMDVHKFVAKSDALKILGIVCSVLSIVCLALTILVLLVYNPKIGERMTMDKHLCICLLIGHLMALIIMDKTYFNTSDDVCVIFGIALHYVFLAVFMWMAIEGHYLYLKIIRVFDSGHDYTRIYFIIGYGVPALIVAITGFVTASLQDTGYGNVELCWLNAPGYVWAFMGPVIAILGGNLVVYIMALEKAISASKKQNKQIIGKIKTLVRVWLSFSALLGVTWLFGFFNILTDEPFFAYIFIILNGCQGVLIFFTRVVFNEKVRGAIKQNFRKRALLKNFYSSKSCNATSCQGPKWYIDSTPTDQMVISSCNTTLSTNSEHQLQTGSKMSGESGKCSSTTLNKRGASQAHAQSHPNAMKKINTRIGNEALSKR